MDTITKEAHRFIKEGNRRALRKLKMLNRDKDQKKSGTLINTISLATTPDIKTEPRKTKVYQPHTLSKTGKATRDLTHVYVWFI